MKIAGKKMFAPFKAIAVRRCFAMLTLVCLAGAVVGCFSKARAPRQADHSAAASTSTRPPSEQLDSDVDPAGDDSDAAVEYIDATDDIAEAPVSPEAVVLEEIREAPAFPDSVVLEEPYETRSYRIGVEDPRETTPASPDADARDEVADASDATTPSVDPQQPEVSEEDYVLKPVYYGTDRKPELTRNERRQQYRGGLWRTAIAGAATLLLAGAFSILPWRKTLSVFTVAALVVTLVFGRSTLLEKQRFERDELDQNRRYGTRLNEIGNGVGIERGICLVSIPQAHKQGSGKFERPDWTEFKVDRSKHFDLYEVRLIDDRQEFLSYVKADVEASPQKRVLLFIHGYNVTFELAAMRTAQLAYDLNFDGPAAFFSWPSNGTASGYASDEESVQLTVPQMSEFVSDLIKDAGAESVHVVAHSMGNRALTEMLRSLERVRNPAGLPVLNQIIMAAPDVNATIFRTKIVKDIIDAARNFTLYASSKDIALTSSELLRRSDYTRLGQGGDVRQVLPGIQTIDASDLPGDAIFRLDLGHSYYVHPAVMKDLKYLLTTPMPARQRAWLDERPHRPSGSYWIFQSDAPGA